MSGSRGTAKYVLPFESPCKDCDTRAVGCHGTCGKYAEYRVRVDALTEEERKRIEYNGYIAKAMKHFPRGRNI